MELVKHELYKICSSKGVIALFIVITLLNGIILVDRVYYGVAVDSATKKRLIGTLQGEITREKTDKAMETLRSEQNRMAGKPVFPTNPLWYLRTNENSKLIAINGAYHTRWTHMEELRTQLELKDNGDPDPAYANSFSYRNNALLCKMTGKSLINEYRYTGAWDNLVGYAKEFGAVIMAAFIVLGLSGMFSAEYASKMDAILLSSKYGKTRLLWAKLAAAAIYILGLLLFYNFIYSIVNLAVFGTQGWDAPMQCLKGYEYSPYHFNILQYWLLQLLLHSVGCIAFGLFVLLVSSLSVSRIVTFFIGIFAYVGPFIIDNGIPAKRNFTRLVTSFSFPWFMQVRKLFESYMTYDWMDNPVLYPVVASVLIGIFAVAAGICTFRSFRNHGMNY